MQQSLARQQFLNQLQTTDLTRVEMLLCSWIFGGRSDVRGGDERRTRDGSVTEIAKAMGMSRGSVSNARRRLVDRGVLAVKAIYRQNTIDGTRWCLNVSECRTLIGESQARREEERRRREDRRAGVNTVNTVNSMNTLNSNVFSGCSRCSRSPCVCETENISLCAPSVTVRSAQEHERREHREQHEQPWRGYRLLWSELQDADVRSESSELAERLFRDAVRQGWLQDVQQREFFAAFNHCAHMPGWNQKRGQPWNAAAVLTSRVRQKDFRRLHDDAYAWADSVIRQRMPAAAESLLPDLSVERLGAD